jgi:hypothetical protein
MGFWQGVAEAYKDISAERTRAREIQDERDYRKKEKEEERAFEKEQFMLKVQENRRDVLYDLYAKRNATKANANEIKGKVTELLKMVDPEDKKAQVFINNPAAGAAVYDTVKSINAKRAENEQPPLTADQILSIPVYTDESGRAKITPESVKSLEEIGSMDLSDPAEFMRIRTSLETASEKPFVSVPTEFLNPDTGVRTKRAIEEKLDPMVLARAGQRLEALAENPDAAKEYTSLLKLTSMVEKGGAAADYAMVKLRGLYGREVIETLNQQDQDELYKSPLIRELFPQDQGVTPKDLAGSGEADIEVQRAEAISQLIDEFSSASLERKMEIREKFMELGLSDLLPKINPEDYQM